MNKDSLNIEIQTEADRSCFLVDDLSLFCQSLLDYSRLYFISDTNTEVYAQQILEQLDSSRTALKVLPEGENTKAFSFLEEICEEASSFLNRKSAVVCVGGGVVGDLGGFFSSIFLRGVDFFLVPTSLLSMVDSSVGGKTAINLKAGKNLVGAFHTPRGIYLNKEALKSLSHEHWISGLSEMLKHGLLMDVEHYHRVKSLLSQSNFQEDLELEDIVSSIMIKKSVVEQDYKEKGMRSILNLGHTIGHALESSDNFALPHGIYVLFGLVYEVQLGARLGICSESLETELKALVKTQNLKLPVLNFEKLAPYLLKDKKNLGEKVEFAFVESPGKVFEKDGKFTTGIGVRELQDYMENIAKKDSVR